MVIRRVNNGQRGYMTNEIEDLKLALQLSGVAAENAQLPTHRQFIAGDMRFHYVEWGSSANPPILFLHGGNQTCRTWDVACANLSQDHHCFALDQRGHGDSEWSYSFDYGPDAHLRDIEAWVDEVGVDRFVLVGMSMGCLNGLHYAVKQADRLAAFVAVDAGPYVNQEGAQAIVNFVQGTEAVRSIDAYLEKAVQFNPNRDPRLLRRSLTHALRETVDGEFVWKTDRRKSMRMQAFEDRFEYLSENLNAITCPTLVLRGGKSDVMTDDQAQRFASELPNGRWRAIPDAGHTIQGDNPKAMLQEIRAFLRDSGALQGL